MFDFQPDLHGPTLTLRGMRAGDRDALYAASSNPATWAGHPAHDRHIRPVFDAYFDTLMAKFKPLVIVQDRIIGCSSFYVPPEAPDDIAIGFTFIDCAHWGGGVNAELKRLMLRHAFATFDTVWFHIAPSNIRSQKATAKIGARHIETVPINLSGTPQDWMRFAIRRQTGTTSTA